MIKYLPLPSRCKYKTKRENSAVPFRAITFFSYVSPLEKFMQDIQVVEGSWDIASATRYLHCCFTDCEDHNFHYSKNVYVSHLQARLKNRDSIL